MDVVESQIMQSLKVRDLGVIFEKIFNFDDHITAICRNTYFYIINICYRIMSILLLFMH